jgi:DNA-binding NtrC family response regulator
MASEDFEKRYLEEALQRASGNLSKAARMAGVSRQFLTRIASKYGLRGKGEE